MRYLRRDMLAPVIGLATVTSIDDSQVGLLGHRISVRASAMVDLLHPYMHASASIYTFLSASFDLQVLATI